MKLDHLLTQFLYQHKRLSLPGIGTFTAEGNTVQFDNKADKVMSEELVEYVKTHTGKMHSLALSDLESYIMLNKQFLNIGKMLYMEGIGSLVKNKEGSFEFTPGGMIVDRLDEAPAESRRSSVFEEDYRFSDNQSGSSRKWLITLGVILTIAIVVWGSWKLITASPEEDDLGGTPPPVQDTTAAVQPVTDSTRKGDSLSLASADTAISRPGAEIVTSGAVPASWKFVILQTTNAARAQRRFAQLKELGKNVKMESRDSVNYKIFFTLPASITDTARIKDSLRIFYNAKVVVEQ